MDFKDVFAYVDERVYRHRNERLKPVEAEILRHSWDNIPYQQMARLISEQGYGSYQATTLQREIGYKLWQTLSDIWPPKINKKNCRDRLSRTYSDVLIGENDLEPRSAGLTRSPASPSAAPGLLSHLAELLRAGNHRLVFITGARGSGKTYLTTQLTKTVGEQFDRVVRHPEAELPSWQSWYRLIYGPDPQTAQPVDTYQAQRLVLPRLQFHRYLLVVDQDEIPMEDEGYRSLLKELVLERHKSCLLWISPMQCTPSTLPPDPYGVSYREVVEPFSPAAAMALVLEKYPHWQSVLEAHQPAWAELVEFCGGNPSVIEMTVDYFDSVWLGQVSGKRLQEIITTAQVPEPLRRYFAGVVAELSTVEQRVLQLLALHPLSWERLQQWPSYLPMAPAAAADALEQLNRRHLLRPCPVFKRQGHIAIPYLGLYLRRWLQETLLQELVGEQLTLFHSYPLVMPQAMLVHQRSQRRDLVAPLAAALLRHCPSFQELECKLGRLLDQARQFASVHSSCAAGSLLNLALELNLSLGSVSWSGLTLWHADLRHRGRQPLDLRDCVLRSSAIAAGFQGVLTAALHPEGVWLAVGDSQGLVQIYERVEQSFRLHSWQALDRSVRQLVLTASGRLAILVGDRSIQLWEATAEAPYLVRLLTAAAAVCGIAVSADGDTVVASLEGDSLQSWDLTWDSTSTTEGRPDLASLAVHNTGSAMVSYTEEEEEPLTLDQRHADGYRRLSCDLSLGHSRSLLALSWVDQELRLAEIDYYSMEVARRTFTLAPDCCDADAPLPIIDTVPHSTDYLCRAAVFSNNGRYLALCDADQTVHVWEDNNRHCGSITLDNPPGFQRLRPAWAIDNSGHTLLCQSDDRVSLWDLRLGNCLHQWATESQQPYQSYRFGSGLRPVELSLAQHLGAIP